MGSGREDAKENERKFSEYWRNLCAKGEYLPLKADGTVWVDKVAENAKIGKSALRQNPQVKEHYKKAVAETLKLHKEKVEALLGAGAGVAAAKVETATVEALDVAGDKKDELKKLKQRISELEQQVAVLTAATQRNAEDRKRAEKLDKENKRLLALIERYEFQTDHAINPGPY